MAINIAVDIHGSTRSRELGQWFMHQLQRCVAVIRPLGFEGCGHNFPFDFLTGCATRGHITNVMCVLPAMEKQIGFEPNTTSRCKNKKIIKEKLKKFVKILFPDGQNDRLAGVTLQDKIPKSVGPEYKIIIQRNNHFLLILTSLQ